MRPIAAIGLTCAAAVTAASLSAVSVNSAGSDGLSDNSLIKGADFSRAFSGEADTRRAELAATRHGLFNTSSESRQLEARVQALLADLASVRTEAATDPLGWLTREGLMDGEPVQADTEHAA